MLARCGFPMMIALLLALAGPAPPTSGPGAPRLQPSSKTPASRPVLLPAGRSDPDSVLAWVGERRQITISAFRRAWKELKPPNRPDSLTPESGKQFLDLLVGKEVLGENALKEQWRWDIRDSARVLGLEDRMVMKVVLDSALKAARARRMAAGDTVRSEKALGIVARDSTVARLHPVFDAALCERMARIWASIPKPSSDSSFMAQLRVLGTMPVVPSADTGLVLVRTRDGDLHVSELVTAWARLNPLQRPRISDADQMEDLTRNVLFERLLRGDAARRRVAEWPEIAAAVDRQREYVAVSHLVAREIYDRLKPDSLSLVRYFSQHEQTFAMPLRVRVISLSLATRREGTEMALRLRDAAAAESLVEQGRAKGLLYVLEVSAESDSAQFARAMRAGPGVVLGPDSTLSGWNVVRVTDVLPPKLRRFEEVSGQVQTAWYSEEGENRMLELIERLKKKTRRVVNAPALARLTAQ